MLVKLIFYKILSSIPYINNYIHISRLPNLHWGRSGKFYTAVTTTIVDDIVKDIHGRIWATSHCSMNYAS